MESFHEELFKEYKIRMSNDETNIITVENPDSMGIKVYLILMNDEQTEALEALNAANTYRAFTMRCRESKNVTAVLKEARPKLEISPNELDSDPYVLCTPTATYDPRKGLNVRYHEEDPRLSK